MGLADRHYMRDKSGGALAIPMWMALLIVNVLVFFAQNSQGARSYFAFLEYGALSVAGLKHWMLWQFVTFQFLHANLTHLLFNLLTLWSFGRPLEMMLGKRRFLTLYLLSGFVGGVAQVLLGLLVPQFDGPTVGASAGICGLIAAFALLYPDSTLYLFFVIPFRAAYFLPLLIVVTSILLLTSGKDHVAHGAHLGGILAGVAWVKLGWYQEYARMPWDLLFDWWHQRNPLRARDRKRAMLKAATSRRWRRAKSAEPAELPEEEFISRQVDPILDKISAHGIQSLTEEEKKILEAARSKMAKR